MLTAWTAGRDRHYFQQQLWQNCTPATPPPPFESSVSEADSLTNIFSAHTSFGGVLFRKLNIEMIYW